MPSDPSAADAPPIPEAGADEVAIQVVVNGEPLAIPAGSKASDLLEWLGMAGRPLAVELNRDVVPRRELSAHVLVDGDELEIVTLVGGG